jgi:hypothetical protein
MWSAIWTLILNDCVKHDGQNDVFVFGHGRPTGHRFLPYRNKVIEGLNFSVRFGKVSKGGPLYYECVKRVRLKPSSFQDDIVATVEMKERSFQLKSGNQK